MPSNLVEVLWFLDRFTTTCNVEENEYSKC